MRENLAVESEEWNTLSGSVGASSFHWEVESQRWGRREQSGAVAPQQMSSQDVGWNGDARGSLAPSLSLIL